MKRQTHCLSLPLLLAALGLFASSFCSAQLRPYVIDKDGTRFEGTAIRSGAGGQIVLTSASGKEKQFTQGGYRKLFKPMPAEFKRAISDFNNGNYDGAIAQFTAIEKGNRYLNWDLHAGSYLVRSYIAKKQPDLAAQTVGRLMSMPGGKQNAIVIGAELQSLIGGGKLESANRKISGYVTGKNREVAAIAQCRRGDVSMGKNLYKQAVLDYLRTVAFYGDADREILAEAKFKTGLALKNLKDASRSQMMFDRVQKEHAGSYWALRAASGK